MRESRRAGSPATNALARRRGDSPSTTRGGGRRRRQPIRSFFVAVALLGVVVLAPARRAGAFRIPALPSKGPTTTTTTTRAAEDQRTRSARCVGWNAAGGVPHAWRPKERASTSRLFAKASSEGKRGAASAGSAAATPESEPKSGVDGAGAFVPAQDLEALQALFAKHCDKQGLMTKAALRKVPAIADLLKEGDLLEEEFNDVWNRAPKFPDVAPAAPAKGASKKGRPPPPPAKRPKPRIDVDSFVQVYRDIDDLFEDDDDDKADNEAAGSGKNDAKTSNGEPRYVNGASNEAVGASATGAVLVTGLEAEGDSDDDEEDDVVEAELETIFESLCDKDKLVSKEVVREWDEVSKLMEDGLLGDDEFEELWRKTAKSPGSDDRLDVYGFLSFNVGLDGLFDFDDDEMDDGEVSSEEADEASAAVGTAPVAVVDGEGLSPVELFRKLTGAANQANLDQSALLQWSFLRDAIDDGDLTEAELNTLFQKASEGKTVLDGQGFVSLYASIDELFEDDDDVPENSSKDEANGEYPEPQLLKRELLDAIDDLNDPDLLPCGLDCTEREQKEILKLVSELETQPTNLIRSPDGYIDVTVLNGSWDLLYSSSSAMRFNKGLSGLGGSFPNGKFGGLRQVLKATKFVSDVEYLEHIEVTPSAASFDVSVTGDWELRQSVSLFTGEPSLVLTVQPDRVKYGVTSMKADHWKSLGPMNMLDVTYLDDDLRIMRGNTAVDAVFVFRRSKQ